MASTGTDDLTLTPHGGGGGDSAEQQQGDGNAGGAEHTPVGQAEGGDKPKAAEWDASLLAVITKTSLVFDLFMPRISTLHAASWLLPLL